MARRNNTLKKRLNTNIGWVLVLLFVAGSSFLLGSSMNKKVSDQTTTESNSTPTKQQSVISDISASLQNPTPNPIPVTTNPRTSNQSSAISAIVNINSGSLAELDTLPGIGPAYAQAIINYRTTNGPFIRIEDIQKVKGIGPKTFEKLKSRITI